MFTRVRYGVSAYGDRSTQPCCQGAKSYSTHKARRAKGKANTNRIVMESDIVENQTNVDGEGHSAAKEAASE